MPRVAAHYDQPFGNSSALPAFYCASMARDDGVERLLAGDGGDELFGGNTRYAKQRIFDAYSSLPAAVRTAAIEPILLSAPAIGMLPVVRKAASYVRQARIPMPDRLNTYNLLTRLGMREILAPEFVSQIDPGEPEAIQRATYAACDARALVNRMLAYDWVYTLADNDLPKVCGTTNLAGLEVAFPLLADELVEFSLQLPPEMKLRGLRLRWFFKEALRGFLPDEIIAKKKHGFGLPFGPWVVKDRALAALAREAFSSLRQRGAIRGDFLDALLASKINEHPGYYGEIVWILTMLELWLQGHGFGSRAIA
jgi:asparagine synthase (glutamine-hydrolysing)